MVMPEALGSTRTEPGSNPAINTQATCAVGENMFTQYRKTATIRTIAVLSEDAEAMIGDNPIHLNSGDSAEVRKPTESMAVLACIFRNDIPGKSQKLCLADKDGDHRFDVVSVAYDDREFALKGPASFQIKDETSFDFGSDSFKREVLYQGTSQGVLRLSVREFSGGLARPAFTQDVTYDLSKEGPTEIAFRELRVKVLKATATDINYVVEQPFRTSLLGSEGVEEGNQEGGKSCWVGSQRRTGRDCE
jgi:hypothetical protein